MGKPPSNVAWERAAEQISDGTPIADVARELKVSRDAVYKRMRRDADFRDLIDRHTEARIQEAVGTGGAHAGEAMQTIVSAMRGEVTALQLRAAHNLLSLLPPMRQQLVIETELARLRELVEGVSGDAS